METTNNLYQKLWSASDDLRNFMDANEYKNYLLGIIFYKYLYDLNVLWKSVIFKQLVLGSTNKEVRSNMIIPYKPLWHLLVEKEMNEEDLKRAAKMTSNIVSRMSKTLM